MAKKKDIFEETEDTPTNGQKMQVKELLKKPETYFGVALLAAIIIGGAAIVKSSVDTNKIPEPEITEESAQNENVDEQQNIEEQNQQDGQKKTDEAVLSQVKTLADTYGYQEITVQAGDTFSGLTTKVCGTDANTDNNVKLNNHVGKKLLVNEKVNITCN